MNLEELEADKVIPVWPAVGEAAVQNAVDYLPDDLKHLIEGPAKCLLPEWEWPERPPRSKVRASQSEWDKIVAAGYARGFVAAVDEEDVFCDRKGRKIVSGAAGVRKLKQVGGETKDLQLHPRQCLPTAS